ncbi:MAG: DnaB-like helicase C-terminal domain-containing protein, partial [Gammaproteobacteria bacterium]
MGYNAGMASNPHPQLHILPRPEAPHAVAAERALLGALLYNNDLWDELDGRITAEDFYDKRHQIIFAAVQKLVADSRADAVLLAQTLKAADKLRDAGGEEYVYDIENISAAVVNVSAYADEIKKTAVLRKMHAVFQSANARVLHPGGSTSQEILDETEALLGDIAAQADSGGAGGFISAADKAAEFFQYLSDIVNRGEFDRLLGLQAGYPRLDQMTTGLHGGDLIVVAARPGGGKTAFALNIIRHVSASGAGVAVFSLEMSDRQLVMRLMSQDRIDMQKMRTGKDRRGRPMSPDDWRALGDAEGNLRGRHIFIDDSGVLNILELKSRSRRLSRQMERKGAKLSLIVVDYLQLLTAPTSKERDN